MSINSHITKMQSQIILDQIRNGLFKAIKDRLPEMEWDETNLCNTVPIIKGLWSVQHPRNKKNDQNFYFHKTFDGKSPN